MEKINFSKEKWYKIKEDYGLWWQRKLKRPLLYLTVSGIESERTKSKVPYYDLISFYNLSISPAEIADAYDYQLSKMLFLGDSFPNFWLNFGPGVMAAFLGANLIPEKYTTWFKPKQIKEISDIKFTYDANNIWLKRIKDVCKAFIDYWQGNVQVGMTDLGGNLDILSTFRPGEQLLFDLYDHSDQVKKLTDQAHDLWWRYFEEINNVLKPKNPGYTAWTPIFSETPYYMLQCDFCYMISPEMFDEFVKPELVKSCQKLVNGFYHLDGPGQLPHLDSLLQIKELKGVQWIPGAGQAEREEWGWVYKKIRDAGKLIQVLGDMDKFDVVVEQLGSAEGLFWTGEVDISQKNLAMEFINKYEQK